MLETIPLIIAGGSALLGAVQVVEWKIADAVESRRAALEGEQGEGSGAIEGSNPGENSKTSRLGKSTHKMSTEISGAPRPSSDLQSRLRERDEGATSDLSPADIFREKWSTHIDDFYVLRADDSKDNGYGKSNGYGKTKSSKPKKIDLFGNAYGAPNDEVNQLVTRDEGLTVGEVLRVNTEHEGWIDSIGHSRIPNIFISTWVDCLFINFLYTKSEEYLAQGSDYDEGSVRSLVALLPENRVDGYGVCTDTLDEALDNFIKTGKSGRSSFNFSKLNRLLNDFHSMKAALSESKEVRKLCDALNARWKQVNPERSKGAHLSEFLSSSRDSRKLWESLVFTRNLVDKDTVNLDAFDDHSDESRNGLSLGTEDSDAEAKVAETVERFTALSDELRLPEYIRSKENAHTSRTSFIKHTVTDSGLAVHEFPSGRVVECPDPEHCDYPGADEFRSEEFKTEGSRSKESRAEEPRAVESSAVDTEAGDERADNEGEVK